MADVRSIVGRAFPDRQVATVRPVRRGNHKRTAVVTFEDGRRVVLQRSARPEQFRTEVALVRAIDDRTDVPVPRVLAEGEGYAIYEHVPGADLHERFVDLDRRRQSAVARTFGRVLAALHESFAFEGYGPVGIEDGEFVATGPTDWRAYFERYAREGIEALPEPFDDLRAPLDRAIETAALPSRPAARLYPWDLRPGNARLADGEVAAVLDWGEPLAAAPGLALAKVEHLLAEWYVDDGTRLREALRAGYRSRRSLPATCRVYRLVAVVRSAVDSRGDVTRPGYPERTGADAVAFHRERILTRL